MRRMVLHEDMITDAQDLGRVDFDTENVTDGRLQRKQFVSKN